MTFICSKTDDISRTEASESFRLEEFHRLDERQDEISREKRNLERELKCLKGTKSDYQETIDQIDEDLETWEDLAADCEDGKTVYAPLTTQKSSKRKREGKQSSASRKKRKVSSDSEDNDEVVRIDSDSEETKDPVNATSGSEREPLESEQIAAKVDELRQVKKDSRREKQVSIVGKSVFETAQTLVVMCAALTFPDPDPGVEILAKCHPSVL